MQSLSSKQRRVIEIIKNFTSEKGYPPSVREICASLGLKSTSTVHGYLDRLEKRGFIKRDPSRPRAIQMMPDTLDKSEKVYSLPLVGSVKAGQLSFAEQNIEDYFTLPARLTGSMPEDSFILRVSGESMINAGIMDGDNIIVQRGAAIINGDIVVALVGDEATVKRFYKENGYIRLQPENDYMEPIKVKDAMILGKVTGLFRRY
jgi:repressor LexA